MDPSRREPKNHERSAPVSEFPPNIAVRRSIQQRETAPIVASSLTVEMGIRILILSCGTMRSYKHRPLKIHVPGMNPGRQDGGPDKARTRNLKRN